MSLFAKKNAKRSSKLPPNKEAVPTWLDRKGKKGSFTPERNEVLSLVIPDPPRFKDLVPPPSSSPNRSATLSGEVLLNDLCGNPIDGTIYILLLPMERVAVNTVLTVAQARAAAVLFAYGPIAGTADGVFESIPDYDEDSDFTSWVLDSYDVESAIDGQEHVGPLIDIANEALKQLRKSMSAKNFIRRVVQPWVAELAKSRESRGPAISRNFRVSPVGKASYIGVEKGEYERQVVPLSRKEVKAILSGEVHLYRPLRSKKKKGRGGGRADPSREARTFRATSSSLFSRRTYFHPMSPGGDEYVAINVFSSAPFAFTHLRGALNIRHYGQNTISFYPWYRNPYFGWTNFRRPLLPGPEALGLPPLCVETGNQPGAELFRNVGQALSDLARAITLAESTLKRRYEIRGDDARVDAARSLDIASSNIARGVTSILPVVLAVKRALKDRVITSEVAEEEPILAAAFILANLKVNGKNIPAEGIVKAVTWQKNPLVIENKARTSRASAETKGFVGRADAEPTGVETFVTPYYEPRPLLLTEAYRDRLQERLLTYEERLKELEEKEKLLAKESEKSGRNKRLSGREERELQQVRGRIDVISKQLKSGDLLSSIGRMIKKKAENRMAMIERYRGEQDVGDFLLAVRRGELSIPSSFRRWESINGLPDPNRLVAQEVALRYKPRGLDGPPVLNVDLVETIADALVESSAGESIYLNTLFPDSLKKEVERDAAELSRILAAKSRSDLSSMAVRSVLRKALVAYIWSDLRAKVEPIDPDDTEAALSYVYYMLGGRPVADMLSEAYKVFRQIARSGGRPDAINYYVSKLILEKYEGVDEDELSDEELAALDDALTSVELLAGRIGGSIIEGQRAMAMYTYNPAVYILSTMLIDVGFTSPMGTDALVQEVDIEDEDLAGKVAELTEEALYCVSVVGVYGHMLRLFYTAVRVSGIEGSNVREDIGAISAFLRKFLNLDNAYEILVIAIRNAMASLYERELIDYKPSQLAEFLRSYVDEVSSREDAYEYIPELQRLVSAGVRQYVGKPSVPGEDPDGGILYDLLRFQLNPAPSAAVDDSSVLDVVKSLFSFYFVAEKFAKDPIGTISEFRKRAEKSMFKLRDISAQLRRLLSGAKIIEHTRIEPVKSGKGAEEYKKVSSESYRIPRNVFSILQARPEMYRLTDELGRIYESPWPKSSALNQLYMSRLERSRSSKTRVPKAPGARRDKSSRREDLEDEW